MPSDNEGVEDPQIAVELDVEPVLDRHAFDDQGVRVRVMGEATEPTDAVDRRLFDLEGLDVLRPTEGVDLQEELTVEAEARHAVAAAGQLHAPDHAGVGPDVDPEVDQSGHRADAGDLGAERTVDLEVGAGARARSSDPDVPVENKDARKDQLRADGRLDVCRGSGTRGRLAGEVWRGGIHGDGARVARAQQRQEGGRQLQRLVLQRRVEHEVDRAGG